MDVLTNTEKRAFAHSFYTLAQAVCKSKKDNFTAYTRPKIPLLNSRVHDGMQMCLLRFHERRTQPIQPLHAVRTAFGDEILWALVRLNRNPFPDQE